MWNQTEEQVVEWKERKTGRRGQEGGGVRAGMASASGGSRSSAPGARMFWRRLRSPVTILFLFTSSNNTSCTARQSPI